MLSPEILKQVRAIQLKAGHLVTEALAGNYLSAFKGRGMEFDEVREYVPGDDVRTLDWNVTARMGAPFVKVLREERELTLMTLVDVSPSQGFGSGERTKTAVAAELAAVLAFLAIRNQDKIGLMAFSDHVEEFLPAKKGRGHVWTIIRTVLSHQGRGVGTNIALALDALSRYVQRRSLCFLISDFWTDGFERALAIAGRRHDLVAVRIRDPLERSLPNVGAMLIEDLETKAPTWVDTSDPRVRAAYAQAAREREQALTNLCRKHRVDTFTVDTDGSTTAPLLRYLRQREARRR